jgi:hypothetical protein
VYEPLAASTSEPRFAGSAVTVVENAAWPASASLTEIEPAATRLPDASTALSSVTLATVGVPIMVVSLTPWTVKSMVFVVPSALVTVKLSTCVWPLPSDWVAAFATE